MFRLRLAVSFGLVTLTLATATLAQTSAAKDIQAWLNAPVWELTYEVSFKSSSNGSLKTFSGPMTFTRTLDRTFSGTQKLNLRNAGPSLSMAKLTAGSEGGASAMSPEQQAAMLEMAARVESMANWMSVLPGFDENTSFEEQQALVKTHMDASMGPARLEYIMVAKGDNLVNELGSSFKQTTRTTRSGAGKVVPEGSLMFELDAESKRYLLTLPITFRDTSQSTVKEETIVRQEVKGEKPLETRTTGVSGLASFPQDLAVDDSKLLVGQLLLVEGDLDVSAGKITGERSVKGHFEEDGETVAGTFVFRYTLTPR